MTSSRSNESNLSDAERVCRPRPKRGTIRAKPKTMQTQQPKLDLIIVGSGPAGLSAADAAREENLDYLVLEAGYIADTIYHYPIGLPVFSTPNELELRPGTLHPTHDKPTREELLDYYVRWVIEHDLHVNTEEPVARIERIGDDDFRVVTSKNEYRARRLIVAVGGLSVPRKLGAPGEDLPHVHYRFVEAFPYVRRDAIVVGGGNSAAEAALFLAQGGARASLLMLRRDWENLDAKLGAMKPWVREPVEAEIERGSLKLILMHKIEEFRFGATRVLTEAGDSIEIPTDVAFVLIGSLPNLSLLRDAGVELTRETDAESPVYDPETFETNVRGLYVAGHFTHARHIAQAIAIPRRVVPEIARSLREAATATA